VVVGPDGCRRRARQLATRASALEVGAISIARSASVVTGEPRRAASPGDDGGSIGKIRRRRIQMRSMPVRDRWIDIKEE
jgi:hypothetical protein